MTLAELLRAKSSEYEVLAEWHGERAPLDEDHLTACQAMLAVEGACASAKDVSYAQGAWLNDAIRGARRCPSRGEGGWKALSQGAPDSSRVGGTARQHASRDGVLDSCGDPRLQSRVEGSRGCHLHGG
jgi:hypothetical protein